MSRHDAAAGAQVAFTSPRYSGDNDDLEIQDIKCDICDKVFTRSEHLRRHKRAHSAEKPFACPECKKRFARLDVLRRHRVGHELKRKGNASDGMQRYSRVCYACASARVKCLRGIVCPRCRSRDLRCEYPSRRSRLEEVGQGDEGLIDRAEEDPCIISCSGENRPNTEAFGSAPKESTWASHLLVAMASNSAGDGQPWNPNNSELAVAAPAPVQTPSSGESPMSAGERLLPESYIIPNEPIIAGAQLIPLVSERNIGSIYNYSGINWLPADDHTHFNQTFGAPSLQSTEASNVHVRDVFTNYSDGDARLSIAARHREQDRSSISVFSGQGNRSSIGDIIDDGLQSIHSQLACDFTQEQVWITQESYVTLTDYLDHASGRDIFLSHPDIFPSLKELNEFAGLYFDKFHDLFPLLHKGTILHNRNGCLLELAISAIGACQVGTIYARKCSESLHELVHALLDLATAANHNTSGLPGIFGLRRPGYSQRLTHLQTRILNVLGMFRSGNPKLASMAREDRAVLVTTCIDSKLLMSNHYQGWQAARGGEEEGEKFLQQWILGELKCRAGYFVWMLDCMMAYESDFRTHMDLLDGQAPLPCPEQIWDEPVLNKAQVLVLNSGPPSLCMALDVLYTEKKLLPNLGELSRILLIHGMYRRVWELSRYNSDNLSDWAPTPLSESDNRIAPDGTARTSSKSVLSRWINGSCDCLDVLHWSAQSAILQASGLEHPTVLHLHLARLILLAPVSDLQEFAKVKLHEGTHSHQEPYVYPAMQEYALRSSLLKWATHDQYKARLAIIHAGSVFWHLRRYRCGAVIEPFAIYIATLVLWAYSVSVSGKILVNSPPGTVSYNSHGVDCTEISHNNESPHQDHLLKSPQLRLESDSMPNYYNAPRLHTQNPEDLEQFESHETSIIQLDRPCDDELVQLFVRFGEKMTPYMARIGDIRGGDSARKILREGTKLLSCHGNKPPASRPHRGEDSANSTWGATENFIAILSTLDTAV